MKLNSILVGSIVFAIACNVSAYTDDLLTLDNDLEDKNSMTWPMLPGESLNELATKFYPKNKAMQKQFVFKTLRLNTDVLPELDPNADFTTPTALVIPTLKSLSFSTRAIKSVNKKSVKQSLHISYNIETAIEKLPNSLLLDYENLVTRNTFLKEELAKLNEKLEYLQVKLNDLKLILDKTLTLPKKKTFKNLDAENTKNKTTSKPTTASPQKAKTESINSFFDSLNKTLWLSILGLIVASVLGSYLLKKYRERAYIKFVNSVTRQQALTSFNTSLQETAKSDAGSSKGKPPTEMQADELNVRTTLDEAKVMMRRNLLDEAAAHLKQAIQTKPKASINLWLYLLEIFRKRNLKEEFEKHAFEMHQIYNVMTPVWEERELEVVVAESLEKFPHILKKITTEWPGEPAKSYLQTLLADNRNGERSGFGAEVLDEILLLIAVLETRNDLWEIKDLIKENAEQIV